MDALGFCWRKNPYKSLFEILHVVFQENKHKGHDFGQEWGQRQISKKLKKLLYQARLKACLIYQS